jgi:uncharacterized membrane protein
MSKGKIVSAIAVASTIIAVTLGLNWAEAEGLVGADISVRAAIALAGLALAWYGNEIPKAIVHSERARTARRFSGWVFAIAGLGSAVGGVLLPVDLAVTAELIVVGGGLFLVLFYCLATRQGPQATA